MNKNHAVKCCYLMDSFQELAESVGRQITWTGTFQKTEYCGDIFIFSRFITHKVNFDDYGLQLIKIKYLASQNITVSWKSLNIK